MSTYCPMCDAQKDLSSGRNDCPDCGTILDRGVHSSPPEPEPIDSPSGDEDTDDTDDTLSQHPDESTCPNCGEPVDDAFAVCPYCTASLEDADDGTSGERICEECGYDDLKPGMKVCPMCSNSLSEANEPVDSDHPGETNDDGAAESPDEADEPPSSVRIQFDAGPVMTVDDGTSLGVEIRKKLNNAGVARREVMRVSRRHVMFKRSDDGFSVVDLESSNGTWLNGDQLDPNEEYPISDGDTLTFADVAEATIRF